MVLCRSAEQAQAALAEVEAWVEANGVELNAEKTHVGDCRQAGQGFEFLGYRFEAGRRSVRPKSLKALRERIMMKTKRTRGDSLAKVIEDINPMLRGWFNYFKHAHSVAQLGIRRLVRRRLRAILRKQEKRPGMGRCLNPPSSVAQYLLRNTRVVHHNCGPCVSEPIPMRKLPTGEPCAGEPHARLRRAGTACDHFRPLSEPR